MTKSNLIEKYILVGCALFNWSETQRMVEISDELILRGYKIVFIGKGKYDFLLNNKPYIREYVSYDEKWYTEERISKMLGMDVCGNSYATSDEINGIVDSEIKIINKYNPILILTGYRMSLTVSARYANIPIAWCLSATLSRLYLTKVLERAKELCKNNRSSGASYQDIRSQFENKIACERLLKNCKTSKAWNEVLTNKNLEIFTSDLDIYTGDLNLMSDAKELFEDIDETKQYHFIGPILNNEKIIMPDVVSKVLDSNNGRKKVLISIGSSGTKETFKKILDATRNLDFDFFISVIGILDKELEEYPDNYYFCEKFPLVDIAKVCDIAIIHGGQGTLYAMIAAKCPFLVLPATFEQRQNVENVLRNNKCGKIIYSYEFSNKKFQDSLLSVLSSKKYKESIIELSHNIKKYFEDSRFASKRAADVIENFVILNS